MALTVAWVGRINQARFNSLCGKILHTADLKPVKRLSTAVDYAGFAVPIILIVMTVVVLRLKVPELTFVIIADIAGCVLLLALILRAVLKWQEKYEEHLKLIGEHTHLIREADALLERKDTVSKEVGDLFIQRSDELDTRDLAIFGQLSEGKRQDRYRCALRESGSGAKCFGCGALPWQFTPGSCQVCGGTPVPQLGATT